MITTPSADGAFSSLARLRRERRDLEIPDRAAAHLAVFRELVDDVPHEVARHREPDALIAAALREDRGVDADQLAACADQRAARVARIDRRVGLDEVLVGGDADVAAPERAHDAERHRLAQLIRIADRHHPLGDSEPRGVAPGHDRQVRRLDLEQREVRPRVDADDGGLELALVGERDGDFLDRALAEHVVVGDDETVGRDDDAGAETRGVAVARSEGAVEIAEELLEERIVEERRGPLPHDLDRRDVRDGADRLLGHAREIGSGGGGGRRSRSALRAVAVLSRSRRPAARRPCRSRACGR